MKHMTKLLGGALAAALCAGLLFAGCGNANSAGGSTTPQTTSSDTSTTFSYTATGGTYTDYSFTLYEDKTFDGTASAGSGASANIAFRAAAAKVTLKGTYTIDEKTGKYTLTVQKIDGKDVKDCDSADIQDIPVSLTCTETGKVEEATNTEGTSLASNFIKVETEATATWAKITNVAPYKNKYYEPDQNDLFIYFTKAEMLAGFVSYINDEQTTLNSEDVELTSEFFCIIRDDGYYGVALITANDGSSYKAEFKAQDGIKPFLTSINGALWYGIDEEYFERKSGSGLFDATWGISSYENEDISIAFSENGDLTGKLPWGETELADALFTNQRGLLTITLGNLSEDMGIDLGTVSETGLELHGIYDGSDKIQHVTSFTQVDSETLKRINNATLVEIEDN